MPADTHPATATSVEVGIGRPLLEVEYPRLPFVWLYTEDSEGEVFWLQAADLR